MPDKENVVIIQPIGAIEQHGPHLPLVVDSAIATAVIGEALTKLDSQGEPYVPAYALPPLCYGKSNEHWHFPGTITSVLLPWLPFWLKWQKVSTGLDFGN